MFGVEIACTLENNSQNVCVEVHSSIIIVFNSHGHKFYRNNINNSTKNISTILGKFMSGCNASESLK